MEILRSLVDGKRVLQHPVSRLQGHIRVRARQSAHLAQRRFLALPRLPLQMSHQCQIQYQRPSSLEETMSLRTIVSFCEDTDEKRQRGLL